MKYPLFACMLFLLFFGCGQPEPQQRPPVVVAAAKVSRMNVPIYRDYVGHASAALSVDIVAQVSGMITSQHFSGGDHIRAGDILFTLDSRQYKAELQKAESSLEQNTASLQIAREKAESYTQLIRDDIISQLDYDQALTDVLNLEAQINQDRANIDIAKINLRFCTIRSPIDGFAGLAGLGVGDYASIGSPTLVSIQEITPMRMNFYVPESHLLRIRTFKNQATLRVQAISIDDRKKIHEGTLTRIDNTIDKDTGTVWMKASFPNECGTMWPGEYYKTRLFITTIDNALVVPEEAIITTQGGNRVFVIKEDMSVEARDVVPGESYKNLFIIEKGLEDGEIVVLLGQINLVTGSKVMIKEQTPTPGEEIEHL